MPFINEHGLAALKKYKYTAGTYGYVDTYIGGPFWSFAVKLLPRWLAPNLVTLLGLCHAITGCFILVYQCPTLTEAAPDWAYLACIYCFFMYQTLDAIDGKQARRTGSSSPLGQLFDHGIDAICCMFSSLALAATLRLGSTGYTLLILDLHIIPFWIANWEETVTMKMRFGVIGVTEAQLFCMLIHFTNVIFGTDFWMTLVFGEYELREVAIALTVLSLVYTSFESIIITVKYCAQRNIPLVPVFNKLLQFLFFFILSHLWVHCPHSNIYADHPILMILAVGTLFAYLVTRLIIAHVTHTKFKDFHMILLPLPFMVANSYSQMLFGRDHFIPEEQVVYGYFGLTVLVYLHFVTSVINEICSSLNIRCFVITGPKAQ